jgi:hypothetical protein
LRHLVWKIGLVCLLAAGPARSAENIDPANGGSQYAWSENAGWWNAEPSGNGGPGVNVAATALTGWIWSESLGWISLSCQNTGTCASNAYGVLNDSKGDLTGYAWSENAGWINFAPKNGLGTPVPVRIDPGTGVFGGYAWGENIGWVSFAFSAPVEVPYQIRTSWSAPTPSATRTPTPGGTPGATPTATATRTPDASSSRTPTPTSNAPPVPSSDAPSRAVLLLALLLLGAATVARGLDQESRP